jgi:hypothetical protein
VSAPAGSAGAEEEEADREDKVECAAANAVVSVANGEFSSIENDASLAPAAEDAHT